jgi:circadian clock protein KaiC
MAANNFGVRARTGIEGLDDILGGGWPVNRLYLVKGPPGAGKTTLGLQFLLEGAKRGERVLYVTLSESRQEVEAVAVSHGWDLAKVDVFEPQVDWTDDENTVFHPSEVELREHIEKLVREVERVNPARVVFDSLSELRLAAQSALHYRRQILRLKRFFAGREVTLLLLDDGTAPESDAQLESIAHGVLSLEQMPQGFGGERRRLRLAKVRGLKFRGGHHDYSILTGGVTVYPRLVAAEHRVEQLQQTASTGNAALDTLLGGGGLDRGTSTLLLGPAGAGKSSIALQIATAAARRGEQAVLLAFDEGKGTLLARARSLGMDLEPLIASGNLVIRPIDPAEVVPDELVHMMRSVVDKPSPTTLVIDSLNGYLHAMPEERHLAAQLHEVLAYLSLKGVVTVMVMAQSGLITSSMRSPVDISYLADTVLLLRFFEWQGRICKAISVMKRRTGPHEDTIRELQMGPDGIKIGPALTGFRGVLTGIPAFVGEEKLPLERTE